MTFKLGWTKAVIWSLLKSTVLLRTVEYTTCWACPSKGSETDLKLLARLKVNLSIIPVEHIQCCTESYPSLHAYVEFDRNWGIDVVKMSLRKLREPFICFCYQYCMRLCRYKLYYGGPCQSLNQGVAIILHTEPVHILNCYCNSICTRRRIRSFQAFCCKYLCVIFGGHYLSYLPSNWG